MRINNFRKKTDSGEYIVSANIVFDNGKMHSVYLSVEEKHKDLVVKDASPFLGVALFAAMKLGEDIYIEGSISEKLYQNLYKIMDVVLEWNIGFRKIKIYPSELVKDSFPADKIGCFFSAGVDSFYTFLKNKAGNEEKITHFIFIHGFDIGLDESILFKNVSNSLDTIAKEENKGVVVVKTDMRDFLDEYIDWGLSHGGGLAAVSIFLRAGFSKIYIAASNSYDQLFPWGSHPDVDPLWSTETLEIIHDGNEANRAEKIQRYISSSNLALRFLRVCYRNVTGKYNCGKCSKCLRTMIELRVADCLDKSFTFPHDLDLSKVKKLDTREYPKVHLEASLKELQKQNRDRELQEALIYALQERNVGLYQKMRDSIAYLDRSYNRNRLYKFLSRQGIIH